MPTIETVTTFLENFAPTRLAESWDNVGLLVGDRGRQVERVMTCLTVTPQSVSEAVDRRVELIVAHHPMPFQPVRQLTPETTVGRLLIDLITAGIAVYCPHTAFDSAPEGINQRLAAGLGLRGIWPLVSNDQTEGAGRWGWLGDALSLEQLAERVKQFLAIERLRLVGDPAGPIRTVAVACGAADEFLEAAASVGCDCMLTGEARFHTCLEAEASGIGLLLPGHFASERFAVECLADVMAEQFPDLEIWASRYEQGPVRWV